MAQDWVAVPLRALLDMEHLRIEPELVGYWARLLARCWERQNGGRFAGARSWTTLDCTLLFGGERGVLEALVRAELAAWDGDALVVAHYLTDKEEIHRSRREAAAKAANARWGGDASRIPPGIAPGTPSSNAPRNAEKRREEERRRNLPADAGQSFLFASGSGPPGDPEPPAKKMPTQPYQLREFWLDLWRRSTGAEYSWPTKERCKEWRQAKELLAKPGGLQLVKQRAELLMGPDCPKWIVDGGRDLGTLLTHWNKLAPAVVAAPRDQYEPATTALAHLREGGR